MNAKKMIDILGGQQVVANILTEQCFIDKHNKVIEHSRSRIHNWYKTDRVPDWAVLAYPNVWAKAKRLLNK